MKTITFTLTEGEAKTLMNSLSLLSSMMRKDAPEKIKVNVLELQLFNQYNEQVEYPTPEYLT